MTEQKTVWVKVKKTGLVTKVTQAYYDEYFKDGWLLEVPDPTLKKAPVKKAAPKE